MGWELVSGSWFMVPYAIYGDLAEHLSISSDAMPDWIVDSDATIPSIRDVRR